VKVVLERTQEPVMGFAVWAREDPDRYTAAAGMRASDPRVEAAHLTRSAWDAELVEFLSLQPGEYNLPDEYTDPAPEEQ
jgi:hypothetical protein